MRAGYPIRSESLSWRVVTGEALVADPAANRVHVLNRSATAAWVLSDGTRDVMRLVAELAELAECDHPRVEVDIERLLGVLEAEGLIEYLPNQGPPPARPAQPPVIGEYAAPEIRLTEPLYGVGAAGLSPGAAEGASSAAHGGDHE